MRTFIGLWLAVAVAAAVAQEARNRPYTVSKDFREVVNYKQFADAVVLKPEHKKMLLKNLFFCSPGGDWQLYDTYGKNKYEKLPSFVTTDAVLQLYHVFFDSTLRNIEINSLSPILNRLTARMLAESIQTLNSTTDPALKQAALKNVAYFGVAARALGLNAPIPSSAKPMVATEFGLITGAKGFTVGAIFPYKVDYSQFIPRGHYTRPEQLKRYFRAMMWYGLVPFAMGKPEKPRLEQIRQALVLTNTLYRANQQSEWLRIYEPSALYVGASDDLTPAEWKVLADKVFGPGAPIAAYAAPAKFQAFVAGVMQLRAARIQSRKRDTGMTEDERQFRFMGQRYVPDSEVLQRLSGDERCPYGLDVMSVLGSARARVLVHTDGGWTVEHDKLIAEFDSLPPATWHSNLYWGWLYALKAILTTPPQGYPTFMRTTAWQDKSLYSALASWTELRHDTILYAKQSAAEMGGEEEQPPYVKGYVEPNLPFYDRVLALTRQSREELTKRSLISKPIADKFSEFEDLIGFLRAVSIEELRNETLTRKEHDRIRDIEGVLSSLTMTLLIAGTSYDQLTDDDLDMALVADVHTQTDSAVTEAVGHSNDIIAIVPIEGKLYIARGSTFSYYEFMVNIAKRMTDQQWKKQLHDKGNPAPPVWTKTFFVPVKARQKSEE